MNEGLREYLSQYIGIDLNNVIVNADGTVMADISGATNLDFNYDNYRPGIDPRYSVSMLRVPNNSGIDRRHDGEDMGDMPFFPSTFDGGSFENTPTTAASTSGPSSEAKLSKNKK